jgi:hypothetical protein
MTAPTRMRARWRLAVALTLLGGAVPAFERPAEAQVPPASSGAVPSLPTPVEITIDVLNDEAVCGPQRVRLPAHDLIALRLRNNAVQPVMFVAPSFFQASEGMRTDVFSYNVDRGGFLAAAGDTMEIVLRTPPPGEYGYVCHGLNQTPTVEGSGFFIVVPPVGVSPTPSLPQR